MCPTRRPHICTYRTSNVHQLQFRNTQKDRATRAQPSPAPQQQRTAAATATATATEAATETVRLAWLLTKPGKCPAFCGRGDRRGECSLSSCDCFYLRAARYNFSNLESAALPAFHTDSNSDAKCWLRFRFRSRFEWPVEIRLVSSAKSPIHVCNTHNIKWEERSAWDVSLDMTASRFVTMRVNGEQSNLWIFIWAGEPEP